MVVVVESLALVETTSVSLEQDLATTSDYATSVAIMATVHQALVHVHSTVEPYHRRHRQDGMGIRR